MIPSMVLPLPCALFRSKHTAAEEVVVSVQEIWGEEFVCLIRRKKKTPTFIQSIANFTFSGSHKAKICL